MRVALWIALLVAMCVGLGALIKYGSDRGKACQAACDPYRDVWVRGECWCRSEQPDTLIRPELP